MILNYLTKSYVGRYSKGKMTKLNGSQNKALETSKIKRVIRVGELPKSATTKAKSLLKTV